MTAAAVASSTLAGADAVPATLHTAPSLPDLLAHKRQRVRSTECLAADDSPTSAPGSPRVDEGEPLGLGDEAAGAAEVQAEAQIGRTPVEEEAVQAAEATVQVEAAVEAAVEPLGAEPLLAEAFAAPLLTAQMGESMSAYYQRLRGAVAAICCSATAGATVATAMEQDGIYLHKRPIRGPNGSSPLAVCGTVLHHTLVYVKQGPLLHSLDYGPANGADVTANVLEEAPCKRVHSVAEVAEVAAAAAAAAEAEAELPYLYLGPAARGPDDPLVQRAVAFAESRPYHALRNNCLHFADLAVRALTCGAVRGAPMLYDMLCGAVPPTDDPMLLLMQMMLRMSWFAVVDGTPLAAAFLEHLNPGAAAAVAAAAMAAAPPPAAAATSAAREAQAAAAAAPTVPVAAPRAAAAAAAAAVDPMVAMLMAMQAFAGSGMAAAAAAAAAHPPEGGQRAGGEPA